MRWSIVSCYLGMCWAVLISSANAQPDQSSVPPESSNAPAVQQSVIAAEIPPAAFGITEELAGCDTNRQPSVYSIGDDANTRIPVWYPLVLKPTERVTRTGFADSKNGAPDSSEESYASQVNGEINWAAGLAAKAPVSAAGQNGSVNRDVDDTEEPSNVVPIATDVPKPRFPFRFPSAVQTANNVSPARGTSPPDGEPKQTAVAVAIPVTNEIRQSKQTINLSPAVSGISQTVSLDETENVPAELPVTDQARHPDHPPTSDADRSATSTETSGCQPGCQHCNATPARCGPLQMCRSELACLHPTHEYCPDCFEITVPGSSLYGYIGAQITNGVVDRMVLYQYDFTDSMGNASVTLSPRGRYQLSKIVRRLEVAGKWEAIGAPISIESSGNQHLDEERRTHVIAFLAECGLPIEPNMVVVCTTTLHGLQGVEADIIHQNMIRQTRAKGSSGAGGGGSQVGNIFGGFGSAVGTGAGQSGGNR